QQQQPNRRPAAAAAAGAAAGAAAAGAAAAAHRTPEPAQPSPPPLPSTGSVTGLALPRFAALRSDEVNMRVGPSTSYPIEWTFQRRDLPVQIVGEFQLWRRIRDAEGAEGWVHSSTLAGRRTVLIRGAANAQEVTLRRRAEESSPAVARLRPGVIGRIRECEANNSWCEVQIAGHRGFLRRAELWGIGAEEEVK
uniref:SH3 domain-containing protein n=1 Tax=Falsiroseomonas sp. TaxID=2870721 RepID=UPI003F70C9D2